MVYGVSPQICVVFSDTSFNGNGDCDLVAFPQPEPVVSVAERELRRAFSRENWGSSNMQVFSLNGRLVSNNVFINSSKTAKGLFVVGNGRRIHLRFDK